LPKEEQPYNIHVFHFLVAKLSKDILDDIAKTVSCEKDAIREKYWGKRSPRNIG